MNPRRLLQRVSTGAVKNVSFSDFRSLIEGFGFRLIRVRGSHHVYGHPDVPEMVNIQPSRSEAKPYQIRQFLDLVERYDLRLEDD